MLEKLLWRLVDNPGLFNPVGESLSRYTKTPNHSSGRFPHGSDCLEGVGFVNWKALDLSIRNGDLLFPLHEE